METNGGFVDAVVVQQLAGLAGILASHQVHFAEDAQGAQGDVLEVADGSGDEIERAGHETSSVERRRLRYDRRD